MNSPNTGIPYVPEGTLDPAAGLNLSINVIDALLQTAVVDMDTTAPPTGPADGTLYIVGAPATGAWAGQENNLARYVSEGDFWQFYAAGNVNLVLNRADGGLYSWDGSTSPGTWQAAVGVIATGLTVEDDDSPPTVSVSDVAKIIYSTGLDVTEVSPGIVRLEVPAAGDPPVLIQLALSDLTTNLAAGTGKAYFRAPYAFTLTAVRASLATASSTGGPVTVDINEAGVSVLSTKLTIDDTEKTSTTAATAAVISDASIADDAEITFDIDDEGTGAKGLIVTLIGHR